MSRPRVAILGANGQVGSEVALLLASSDHVEIRGVVRAAYGAAFLRLANIPYATASVDDMSALLSALHDCDLVVDFTYPGGQLVEIPDAIERNARAIFASMQRGARYLQMSSIMAYGMTSGSNRLRFHRVPRAAYGRIKRWAEQKAIELGRQQGIRVFPCRLGQVHGVLQSVTDLYRSNDGELYLLGEPDSPTSTIFTNAVADAVVACAKGALVPERIYTLVSNPQWTLSELGEAYRQLYDPKLTVTYQAPAGTLSTAPFAFARRVAAGSLSRDLLEAHLFGRAPALFARAKGAFRVRSTKSDAAKLRSPAVSPIAGLLGRVPGSLIAGIDSSLDTTVRSQRNLEARLNDLLERARS